MCIFRDLDDLAYKVHSKVIDKLADKISDDVVYRILSQIAENKKEKGMRNFCFSIEFQLCFRYDLGNYL